MPTKTKTKSKTPLRDELDSIYELRSEWQQKRKEAGRSLRELRARIQDLADQRLSWINRDRTLVDHDLMPVSPDNEVGVIDEQLQSLPDLGEAQRLYDHAKALEEQYDREATHYVQRHYAELVTESRPEADQVAAEVDKARLEFLSAIERYKQVRDLNFDWAHAVQGLDPFRVVPGGHLIDLLNQVRDWTIPAPVDPLETPEAWTIHDPSDPDLNHRGW